MRASQKIVVLAVALALCVWALDNLVDYLLFFHGDYWGLLWREVPAHELFMRLIVFSSIVGFGLVAGHVVERLHRTERKLVASRKWLATTLSSIGDAVIATDKQGTITFLNPAAEALTGWPAAEAQGRPLRQVFAIINEYTRQPVENPVSKVLAAGEVVGLANHTILIRRNGEELPIEDSGAPIKDGEGRVDGVVLVFRDVSQRRQAERERARLESQLRQSQKLEAIGTLAGGIAHDFNNILGVIMGYSELALNDARQGACDPNDLEQVLAASQRGKKLVRQILAYSRRAEVELRPLEINQVVKEAAALLEHTLPKMVSLELELEPQPWPVSGDPIQIEQILMNLAANARDAMPQGGRLTISTANLVLGPEHPGGMSEVSPGDYLKLTVSDTGTGMDADTLSRAFDPFYTTKAPDQGTGLGLSTAYGIVKNHGGYVDCHSQPGQGATFDLYFPARSDASAALDQRAEEEAPGGQERILLVDDEAALRELGRRLLGEAGYRVLTAISGEHALERYQEAGGVQLVVLDVNMPGMGGNRCLAALRELDPALPVVIASGYSADNVLRQIGEMGVQAYVAKPFLRAELLKAVRQVLDSR